MNIQDDGKPACLISPKVVMRVRCSSGWHRLCAGQNLVK